MIEYSMYVLLKQAEKMLQPLKQKQEKEAIVHMLLLFSAWSLWSFSTIPLSVYVL